MIEISKIVLFHLWPDLFVVRLFALVCGRDDGQFLKTYCRPENAKKNEISTNQKNENNHF
jgi:hypothetical protein